MVINFCCTYSWLHMKDYNNYVGIDAKIEYRMRTNF